MTEACTYYVVRNRADGSLVYRGHSMAEAARCLEPGTCYGSGSAMPIAEEACHVQCWAARESGKTLAHDE